MKKSRFTEEQIVATLAEAEGAVAIHPKWLTDTVFTPTYEEARA